MERYDKSLKDLLISSGVIRKGDFTLTSGIKSSEYIDIKKASTNPLVLKSICEKISSMVGPCDRIGGMELGSIPLVVGTSLINNIPFLMIRKSERVHGSSSRIEGEFIKDMEVVIIEDVTTSGKSIIQTIEVLRNSGLRVSKAISIVDREMGAIEEIKKMEVTLIPLISISDIRN